ncbi:MAG: ABC transporter ATP-binding protein [Candidatus Omnitrophota bacterium]|nr:ABC transporter ATP-binding protein [Candidatus Omnitrophota bacterium]
MTIVKCGDVKKYFKSRNGVVKALDGVSLEIQKGEVFGLVGESGCGKTTLGKIMLGIMKQDSGNVILGTDKIQAVFQDPYNSLDPKMRVFDILSEGLIVNSRWSIVDSKAGIRRSVEEVLDLIKLPKEALKKYPHQFSGGERQRIAIGRAVLTKPEFIVCDEPVSSLDVTIQLQILNLLKDIQKRLGVTCLFISHDLKVIKFICDKVAVMFRGKIVETGSVRDIYGSPAHSYTETLLKAAFYDNIENNGRKDL